MGPATITFEQPAQLAKSTQRISKPSPQLLFNAQPSAHIFTSHIYYIYLTRARGAVVLAGGGSHTTTRAGAAAQNTFSIFAFAHFTLPAASTVMSQQRYLLWAGQG